MTRRRLDTELVRRGLVDSRTRAQDVVREGRVLVSGSIATKPGRMVTPAEPIEVSGPPPRYVGRGGEKLDAALAGFGLDVGGIRCLDVGASTGGFTDCLLQHGAAHVVALDVGRGQLDWRLRNDDRVTSMERTDVRDADPATIGPVGLVVADVSFISLRTVLPAILQLAGGADIVALVKPQFEVGRANVPKGGVVLDNALHRRAVDDVVGAAEALGLECRARMESPVAGAEGNKEFFVHLVRKS